MPARRYASHASVIRQQDATVNHDVRTRHPGARRCLSSESQNMSVKKPHALFKSAGGSDSNLAQERLTVWFDGACPLCSREIALFRRMDKKRAIRFLDIRSPETACPLSQADLLARFHAQEPGLPLVSGAAAFAAMWRAIPILRPFGELARVPLLLKALEFAYVAFLKFRPALQRHFNQGRAG